MAACLISREVLEDCRPRDDRRGRLNCRQTADELVQVGLYSGTLDLLKFFCNSAVSAKRAQHFLRSAIISIALRPRSTIGELCAYHWMPSLLESKSKHLR